MHHLKRFSFRQLLRKEKLLPIFVVFVALGIGGLFLFNPWNNSVHAAWFNDSWAYRKAITVTVTSSASDISNLDTLITIDTTGMTANLQTNCEDLRFTDVKGTILNYFIDSCNDNSSSNNIWVRVNTVPKNTTTYTLYMYYGNASASAGSNSTLMSLYNGLEGYWAMNETSWNTTSGEIKDNSVNGANGTARNDATTTASGQFNRGALLDGSADSFTTADNANAELGGSDFTIATWVYMTAYPSTGFGASIISKDDGAAAFAPYALVMRSTDNNVHSWMSASGSSWDVMNDTNLGGSSALTLNTWHHVAFVRDSGSCKLYIDTVVTSETSSGISCSGTLVNTAAKPYFGGQFQSVNGNGIAGRMDDARIYKRALSSTDLTSLYTNPGSISTAINATSVPSSSFAAEEKAPAPVAYWKFDDGQGTTVANSTVNSAINGTTNGTWQTEDHCLSGKCVLLNGSTQGTTVPYSSSLNTNNFTISTWVNWATVPTGTEDDILIERSQSGTDKYNYYVYLDANGSDNGSGVPTLALGFTNSSDDVFVESHYYAFTPTSNTWYNLTFSMDDTNNTIKFFVNGNQVLSQTEVAVPNITGSQTIAIGRNVVGDSVNFLKGSVDEYKIYNYVLTEAQIKANYNARSNPEGLATVLGTNTQNNSGTLSNGLVGYWKMDGTSGNATDSSGNGYTLTNTNTATFAGGKFGNAGSFSSASSQYFTIASNTNFVIGNNSRTFTAWVKLTSKGADRHIFGKWSNGLSNNEYGLYYNSSADRFRFEVTPDGASANVVAADADDLGSPATGTWYFVVGTYNFTTGTVSIQVNNGAVNSTSGASTVFSGTNNLTVGSLRNSSPTNFWNGTIDEARIYNRALSSTEVSQLYNWAPGPVGYWKMDENVGTTAYDSSGFNNNGALGSTTAQPSWSNGKYGSALSFDGDDTLNVTDSTTLSLTNAFSLSAWIKVPDVSGYKSIITKESTSQTGYFLYLNGANVYTGYGDGSFHFQTTSSSPISANVWVHIASSWDGTTLRTYVNGTLVQSSAPGGSLSDNSETLGIGNASDLSSTHTGLIDDAKVYNYARSSAQIVEDMNGGHPAPGSPVGSALGYWKFDEGYGTVAHNSGNSGSALDLTLSDFASPATTTSGWSNSGKFNKALNFDGTNDKATGPSETVSDDLDNLTISAWIFPRSGSGSLGRIMDKTNGGTGFRFLIDNGNLNFSASHASGDLTHITNATVALNTWQHVAVTWDGSSAASNAKIYINGVEQTSYLETTNGSGSRSSDASQAIGIGNRDDGTRPFDGLIDEVKLYNQVLTTDQLKLDMNHSQAQVLGATGDNTNFAKGAEAQKYCVPGDTSTCTAPVLSYDLNEGTGTTANDSSGYENGGASNIIPGNGGWVNGKSDGKAYSFDGLSTHIFGGSNSILDNLGTSGGMTAEAWIYPKSRGIDSNNAFILAKNVGNSQANGGWLLLINGISGNQVGLQFVVDGSTDLVRGTPATTVTLNQWNHVVVSWNGVMTTASSARIFVNGKEATYSTTTNGSTRPSDASSSLYIGNASSLDRTFDGYIDQVKIFNYNRSPAQIAYDYNQGKPVGYWKMDECQGTTINDSSGNGFTGALTNATAGTCSTSSTAWGDGATGKRNASLSLDGTNDYVDLGTISSPVGTGDVPFSISAWVKPSTVRLDGCVFSYGGASSGQVISLCSDGSGKIYSVHYGNDHSFTTAWTLGVWQHVIITYDPVTSTETLYVNGQLKESWTPSNLDLQSSATSYLGRASWNGVYFNSALIDDVRLYNYPLTAIQAKNLTNEGAFRVGPATGSP